MNPSSSSSSNAKPSDLSRTRDNDEHEKREVCPVCGGPLLHEKCKVVCRSERCVYRIIYNCAEF